MVGMEEPQQAPVIVSEVPLHLYNLQHIMGEVLDQVCIVCMATLVTTSEC